MNAENSTGQQKGNSTQEAFLWLSYGIKNDQDILARPGSLKTTLFATPREAVLMFSELSLVYFNL